MALFNLSGFLSLYPAIVSRCESFMMEAGLKFPSRPPTQSGTIDSHPPTPFLSRMGTPTTSKPSTPRSQAESNNNNNRSPSNLRQSVSSPKSVSLTFQPGAASPPTAPQPSSKSTASPAKPPSRPPSKPPSAQASPRGMAVVGSRPSSQTQGKLPKIPSQPSSPFATPPMSPSSSVKLPTVKPRDH